MPQLVSAGSATAEIFSVGSDTPIVPSCSGHHLVRSLLRMPKIWFSSKPNGALPFVVSSPPRNSLTCNGNGWSTRSAQAATP